MIWFRSILVWAAAVCCCSLYGVEPKEITLTTAAAVVSTTVQLPGIPAAENGAILTFDARVVAAPNAGWSHALGISVNDAVLNAQRTDGARRLQERSEKIQLKKGTLAYCRAWRGGNKWLLFSGPEDSAEVDTRIVSDRQFGYKFKLDVSDLVQPGKPVQVTFSCPITSRDLKGGKWTIKIKDIQLIPADKNVVKFSNKPQSFPAKKFAYPTVWKENRSISLACGAKPAKAELKFPAVKPRRGHALVLHFDARIVTGGLSGWNPFMAFTLNGKRIGRLTDDTRHRLLRRGMMMKTTLKASPELDWWRSMRGRECLMTFFAPLNTEQMDPRLISPREEGYNYYIDVTDSLNYLEIGADGRTEGDKENILDIYFMLIKADVKGQELKLVLKDINLLYIPLAERDKLSGIVRTEFKRSPAAATLNNDISQLRITADGGMELTVNGEDFFFGSNYSIPARPAMKFNYLGSPAKNNGESSWKPTVKTLSGKSAVITVSSAFFDLKRQVALQGDHYTVTDTFTNRQNSDYGMVNQITLGCNDLDLARYRLAGQPGVSSVAFFGMANPSMFAMGKKASVGVVADDTPSRAQMIMRAAGNVLSMGSDGMGIPAGKSVTRVWHIYPQTKKDYFAFINAVRRDWNLNSTIPGPYVCNLSARVPEGLNGKVVMVAPWFEYYDSQSKIRGREAYVKHVTPRLQALLKKYPGVYALGQLENNLIPFDCSTVPWGDEIPQRDVPRNTIGSKSIRYGGALSASATAKLDAVTPYRDSIIRDAKGNALIDSYYPEKPYVNLMVQPEIGNHRYKTFLEQIDFLMDKVGFNAIYIDQFQPGKVGGASENRWDGHSVTLNPDGTIKSKRYDYAITGASARAAIAKYVISKGGLILTNGQPVSREEIMPGRLCFSEAENDEVDPIGYLNSKPPEYRWLSINHLGVPISLGLRPAKYESYTKRPNRCAQILIKNVITSLRNGVMHYAYTYDIRTDGQPDAGSYELFNCMFPFTTVELNEGFLVGKERTITAISGEYQSNGKNAPEVRHFNYMGHPTQKAVASVSGKPGDWKVKIKLDDWNEVAVIINK